MVVKEFPNFVEWIAAAGGQFSIILLVAALLGIFVGYLVTTFRHGPFEAFYIVAQVLFQSIPDFIGTSVRRIGAIARLAIKEALRRRVILASFVLFFAAIMFGGWFMNADVDHPNRVLTNFVLWGTQMLVLLVGVLISSFSLPDDIKNKTIYTVVTKPVRPTEVILGRIVGFGLLGTMMLVIMGIVSFFFVWRGLSHTHQLVGDEQTMASFIDIEGGLSSRGKRVAEGAYKECQTTTVSGHSHRVDLVRDVREADDVPAFQDNIWKTVELDDGRIEYHRLICSEFSGHSHLVTVDGEGEDARVTLGPAAGFFRARVPVYPDALAFHDRDGQPKEKGISVGREWEYRGYVDGGSILAPNTLSKAIFDFENFDSSRFQAGDYIPLEMTLSVFRTYKADIEKRVMASISVESVPDNPDVDRRFESEPIPFETNEYTVDTMKIPTSISGRLIAPDGTVQTGIYNLFDDYAANGNMRLVLRCEDRNQYIGVARADIYFRSTDNLYWLNFLKGYIGIWCQMMIVIAMGVAFSTFLSAPLTMLMATAVLILGFSSEFIRDLVKPDSVGGGPIESFFRIITQKNMMSDLDTGIATTMMEQTDKLLIQGLNALTYLAPDFGRLSFADFLTYGYAINTDRILVAVSITLAFVIGLSILGYFSLKTREIAK